MKKLLALAVAAAVAPAFAADNVYVGGDIGSTKLKAAGDSASKTGQGAFIGYTLNENVAVEAAYRRLGSAKVAGHSIKGNALQVSVLGIAPLTKEVALYGRLGITRNSVDDTFANVSASASKTKALWGAGVSYQIDKHIGLRAEYSNLGNNQLPKGDIKVSQFNFGATYSF